MVPSAPQGRVSDYANLLAPADRQRLETYLADRETATGTQMAIAIFPSLEGESLEDFSIRLAQQWRIGQKGLDNGVILVVFVSERRLRFEMGYGLEPVIPDAVASGIIRDVIAPRFREGRYAAGLEDAARAVYARIQGQDTPGAARPASRGESRAWPVVGFFVLLGIIVFMLLIEAVRPGRRARRNAYTAGRGGWDAPAVVLPPWWAMGSGRSRGGGPFSGGGFSGGGFSGGGGSFGGGGASGEW